MKEKEPIINNCQFCAHSAKEYLCIGSSMKLIDAKFCMNSELSKMEKRRRMKDKEKCEYFEPADRPKEERLSDIQDCLNIIQDQLNTIDLFLHWDENKKK